MPAQGLPVISLALQSPVEIKEAFSVIVSNGH